MGLKCNIVVVRFFLIRNHIFMFLKFFSFVCVFRFVGVDVNRFFDQPTTGRRKQRYYNKNKSPNTIKNN